MRLCSKSMGILALGGSEHWEAGHISLALHGDHMGPRIRSCLLLVKPLDNWSWQCPRLLIVQSNLTSEGSTELHWSCPSLCNKYTENMYKNYQFWRLLLCLVLWVKKKCSSRGCELNSSTSSDPNYLTWEESYASRNSESIMLIHRMMAVLIRICMLICTYIKL